MSTVFRKGSFWLLVALGLILALFLRNFSLLLDPEALVETLAALGPWTAPVFVAAHILATMVGIPATLLVLIGGATFGLWWGSLWSLVGATAGATAAFWVSRYLLQDWFRRRFAQHQVYRNLDKVMDTHSFNCVLAARFAPLSPFCLVNFLFGLTSVPVAPYFFRHAGGHRPRHRGLHLDWPRRPGSAARQESLAVDRGNGISRSVVPRARAATSAAVGLRGDRWANKF